jgi:hypothetical protein
MPLLNSRIVVTGSADVGVLISPSILVVKPDDSSTTVTLLASPSGTMQAEILLDQLGRWWILLASDEHSPAEVAVDVFAPKSGIHE